MSKINGANLLKKIDRKDFKISFALKREIQTLIIKRNNILNNLASLQTSKQASLLSSLTTEDLQELDKIDALVNDLKDSVKKAKIKYEEALLDSNHKDNSKAIETIKALESEAVRLSEAKNTKMGFLVMSRGGMDKMVDVKKDQEIESFFEEKEGLDFEIFTKLTDYFGLSESIKNMLTPEEIEGLIEAVVNEPSNYFTKSLSDLFTSPHLKKA